ncbi:hypothetical protein MRA01_41420 [Methylobacterium radiotolerans]|nr:hypothetical protein MRA01_41420 [Methylobacterium radiotolerans]
MYIAAALAPVASVAEALRAVSARAPSPDRTESASVMETMDVARMAVNPCAGTRTVMPCAEAYPEHLPQC